MNASYIMVIYDGIHNSVFEGQVMQPLIAHRAQYPNQPILLISFERNSKEEFDKTAAQLQAHTITLIVLKKYPLITRLPLWLAHRQLQNILRTFAHYQLLARGPLAGYACLHARDVTRCTKLTIQARGLLTEEYIFSTKNITGLTAWYHAYKIRLFRRIEQFVYGSANTEGVKIQAVSTALKDYLINTYNAREAHITIANHDIPALICPTQKTAWRTATRAALTIADTTHVYCYNGSAKAWQCPQETITYFKEQYARDSDSLLLILTQDVDIFKQIVLQHTLNANSYRIMHVEHAQIYRYLAACDTGIIMRDNNIINWTSRPTKILEYQAVGLALAHNNSIGYLQEVRPPSASQLEQHWQP